MTTIRAGEPADVPALLEIEAEFRRAGLAEWAVMDAAWFERKIRNDEILVAVDDTLVAYLTWTILWRLPWIEFVRVQATRRREGIGTALVRALEERMRAADGYILVSSTTGGEEAPLAWHHAIGFEDGGRIEWGMWPGAPDEVLLYKRL